MKTFFALVISASLTANLFLAMHLYHTADRYMSLLTWACNNASLGGWECGEE